MYKRINTDRTSFPAAGGRRRNPCREVYKDEYFPDDAFSFQFNNILLSKIDSNVQLHVHASMAFSLLYLSCSIANCPSRRHLSTCFHIEQQTSIGLLVPYPLSHQHSSATHERHAGPRIYPLQYSVLRMVLSKLQIPSATLTTSSSGLHLQASGISAHASIDWSYKQRNWYGKHVC